MTFEQFRLILIKRWQIILTCFLVIGLGTFIGSKLMKPLYQSSVLVQVVIRSGNNNQADYNSLMASDQLVQTEATLAVSGSVLDEVASHYPGLTPTQLAGEASSTTKLSTQLFEIDVIDPSPKRAADLANDIAATLIKQQSQAIQQDNSRSQQQIQQELDQTSQQIDETTAKISSLQAKRGSQAEIALLQAQLNGLEQHYNQWQTSLAQLELTQAQQNGDFLRIAQPAMPATSPVRPDVPLYAGVGLLAGLLVGLLLALLYEQLDMRIHTPEELGQLLAWPVLATVRWVNSSKREDLINPQGHDTNTESYRILRTNIGFSSLDKPLHSIIVTSAMPHDGKSLIAANLAIFMAKAGKNTLLIDADLHRPTQHTLFGLPPEKPGLSNAIMAFSMPSVPSAPAYHQFLAPTSTVQPFNVPSSGNLSLEPFVHSVGIPNLWVMPSGPLPPNPSELLESKVMQRFHTVIADSGVEIVIFDSPPLLGLSDSSILASKVDGALVVVDIKRATKGKLKQMKAVLTQAGVHVLGCVANKQRHRRKDTAYSYYYYYRLEEPNGQEQSASNGHAPTASITHSQPVSSSPFEQRTRSN